MPNKTIIRSPHNKDNPFTQIVNETIRDFDITDGAKCILFLVYSLPSNFQICHRYLAKVTGKSEETISKIMKELVDKGYAERVRQKGIFGRWMPYTYKIFEKRRDINTKPVEKTSTGPVQVASSQFLDLIRPNKNKKPSYPISFPSIENENQQQEEEGKEGSFSTEEVKAAKTFVESKVETPIHACLQTVAIKHRDKERLSQQYPSTTVEQVVAYLNKKAAIRTTLDRAIFHYCRHPEHMNTNQATTIPTYIKDALVDRNIAFWKKFKELFVDQAKKSRQSWSISLKDHANYAIILDEKDIEHRIYFSDSSFNEQVESVLRKNNYYVDVFNQFFTWCRQKIFPTQQLCQT